MGEFIPDDADFGRPTYAPVAAVDEDDTAPLPSRNSSTSHFRPRSTTSTKGPSSLRARLGLLGVARRTLGILLLLFTVFMWTLSNFLASYIFSDNTYSKPFFLVYANTSLFAVSLVPMGVRYVLQNGAGAAYTTALEVWREGGAIKSRDEEVAEGEDETGALLLAGEDDGGKKKEEEKLSVRETAWLSLEFCMLWFLANYFASACLEYTSVASATILTSTSSIWTLIACAMTGVEPFTVRKLGGVVASMAGVVLISSVDLAGQSNDGNRGNFPHKTTGQIAIGDAMAFVSAIIYGIYVTVMKRRVGNEDRVNMPLFFGLVGLLNLVFLWPGFFILHFTGIETFEWPPTGTIWTIIIVNSVASFLSDMSWAYAMLLTTPLVVTVGISLTIPLSLIGEMIQYAQFSSWVYWVGAGIVFVSFVFVNHESTDGEDEGDKEERTELSEELRHSGDVSPLPRP
ncbi:hypothetical protein B0T18DRAFT_318523 [Schizothecium vesticola]|uniref:DUF3955 domain-containing protein n=1 Tax=Schizothecium vesticola TaxID=314040 RepID=A0AA40F7F8_9PEZI|nr:hypothetical protein B0T18DRAFT_318523 [Schizothecium vesticola]